ncbi:hypothetical protein CFP56_028306 [Quercus suber]|uniref:Uncharacterized protein n=1 Tax=Quercus suber TaxID=58331 RepID=A0AAW0LV98_QUESU
MPKEISKFCPKVEMQYLYIYIKQPTTHTLSLQLYWIQGILSCKSWIPMELRKGFCGKV